jgi:hypothetical protein
LDILLAKAKPLTIGVRLGVTRRLCGVITEEEGAKALSDRPESLSPNPRELRKISAFSRITREVQRSPWILFSAHSASQWFVFSITNDLIKLIERLPIRTDRELARTFFEKSS